MKYVVKSLVLVLFTLLMGGLERVYAGENLVENGDFENPEDPFKNWCIDLDWMGNKNNMNNKANVSLVELDGVKKNVMAMKHGNREPSFYSPVVKFEYGKKYRFTFDCRSNNGSGMFRIYVKGLKWKSGVKPYPNPHIGDTQTIYRGNAMNCTGGPQKSGSNTTSATSKTWKTVVAEFPLNDYNDLSDLAKSHMKPVRMLSLFCVMVTDASADTVLYIDNLKVEEI